MFEQLVSFHPGQPISQAGPAGASAGRGRTKQESPKQIMVTGVGLDLPPVLEYTAWEQAGRKIARIADTSAWCLGDWLIYGQKSFGDRYQQAIEAAGLDYQTLRNYAWTARKFELSRRRRTLSFQHHAEVASLPAADQDTWLDEAERHSWSRNELRRNVRASRQNRGLKEATEALPKLSPPAERVARWRAAADKANRSLEDWIVDALDDHASQTLSG